MLSIYKKKKYIICTNCGKKNHDYKQCHEPVTSWGIILVNYGNAIPPTHNSINLKDTSNTINGYIETLNDGLLSSAINHNIMFLMISRKYSVGYVEFIRGRYRPEKIDQVIYLFKQMKQTEIDKIKNSLTLEDGFDYLWKDFWGNKHNMYYLSKDYKHSKENYIILKFTGVDGPEINLHTITDIVKIDYVIDEWGFPKGRRNKNETDISCAIREFKEETGYNDDDFKIITEIKPLEETFVGTNGILYKHIYYVAELVTNKTPINNITESQKNEIGNIQFMNFQMAHICIRDYHTQRRYILERLYLYYMNILLLSNKNNIMYTTKKNSSSDVKSNTTL